MEIAKEKYVQVLKFEFFIQTSAQILVVKGMPTMFTQRKNMTIF